MMLYTEEDGTEIDKETIAVFGLGCGSTFFAL